MRSRDQGKFWSIKNLDPGRGWFYSPYESDYPMPNYYYLMDTSLAWPDRLYFSAGRYRLQYKRPPSL